MDPISLAVGAAAGFGASKVIGGKKKTSSSKPKRKSTKSKSTTSKKKSTASSSKKKTIRKHQGINQTTGRLKKGWKYGANGRIVKAKSCK